MAVCAGMTLYAQDSSEAFISRYDALVKRVGYSGVGVETLLDRWEKAFPDDPDMLIARFNYYLEKSASTRVVAKSQDRFLGAKPVIVLKDTLGADVNYFEETFYEDSLFALASSAIDRAVKACPDRLDLRFAKITSLIAYEKESPDMATAALSALIDYDGTSHPVRYSGILCEFICYREPFLPRVVQGSLGEDAQVRREEYHVPIKYRYVLLHRPQGQQEREEIL